MHYFIIAASFAILIFYISMNLELGNNKHLNITFNSFAAIGTIIVGYTLYSNFMDRKISNITNGINLFNNLFGNMKSFTTNFFETHENMKYYYDELYLNISDYKESDRNKYLENIYSFEILHDIDSIINYIDSYKLLEQNNFEIKIAEEKIIILIRQLFNSKIFTEYWHIYKSKYALGWTKTYIGLVLNKNP